MTQRERAEVAAKVFGIALLVLAVDALPWAWDALRGSPASDACSIMSWLYLLWRPWGLGLLGVLCIWKAPGLSRRLLVADNQPSAPPVDTLRVGVAIIGGVFLMFLPNSVLRLVTRAVVPDGMLWSRIGIVASYTAFAVLFVFRTDKITTFLKRLAGCGPNSLPAAGVVLLGAYMAAGGLARTAEWGLQAAFGPVPDFAARVGESIWWVTYLVEATAVAATGLLAVRYADWLASRCGGAGEKEAGEPAPKGPGGATVMTGALCIGMAWLLLHHLDRFFGRTYWDPLEPPSLPLSALKAVAQVALVVAAFWGAGFSLPGLGSRLNGGASQGEDDGRNLAVLVEVGLAVLSLHYLVNWVSVAIQYAYVSSPSFASFLIGGRLSLTALAVPLTFLVFRADLARMVVRVSGPLAEVPREARVAALRPWLVLLGLYMLLRDVPMLIGCAARLLATSWDLWTTQLPPPGLLFGLALLLASAPLSRALSYGPFLRRGLHSSGEAL